MYDYLVPNSPRKRIEYVYKTLPKVAYETARICAHTVGANREVIEKSAFWESADGLAVAVVSEFSEAKHPHEAMIPWVAVQLNAIQKDVDRGVMMDNEYDRVADALEAKLPQIAAWVARARPDLTQLTIGEALRQMGDAEPEAKAAPQGDVIYRFDDGWTVQDLTTEEQIFAEGESVQNCLRGSQSGPEYARNVAEGTTRIFSLRTENGRPCVSMEFAVNEKNQHGGWFVQVYAKQNTGLNASVEQIQQGGKTPGEAKALWSSIQKYKPRVQEFVRNEFDGEPRGLLLSGVPARDVRLAGLDLSRFDLSGLNLEGACLDDMDLHRATLVAVRSGGILGRSVALPYGYLLIGGYIIGKDVDLSGADLGGLDLSHAALSGVSSGGIVGEPRALPSRYVLRSGFLIGPGVSLHNADLSGIDMGVASLRGAVLYGANLHGTSLADVDLTRVFSGDINGTPAALPADWRLINGYLVGRQAQLQGADFRGVDFGDATICGASLSSAHLEGADLSGVNLAVLVVAGGLARMVEERLVIDCAHYNRDTKWPEGFDPLSSGRDLNLVPNHGRKSIKRKTSRKSSRRKTSRGAR